MYCKYGTLFRGEGDGDLVYEGDRDEFYGGGRGNSSLVYLVSMEGQKKEGQWSGHAPGGP